MRNLTKKYLFQELKRAGLPYTVPNFLAKYEHKICEEHGKPFLVCYRNEDGDRVFSSADIKEIIEIAKGGWFVRHWHWPPLTSSQTKG